MDEVTFHSDRFPNGFKIKETNKYVIYCDYLNSNQKHCRANVSLNNSAYKLYNYTKFNCLLYDLRCFNFNKCNKPNEFLIVFDFETIGMDDATFNSDILNVRLPMVLKLNKFRNAFELLTLFKF